MSSREKQNNVVLVCLSFILTYYIVNWVRIYRTEGLNSEAIFRLWWTVMIAAIILIIVGIIATMIGSNIVHAIKTGKEDPQTSVEDERDKMFELKGEYASSIVFSLGVVLSMLTFVLGQPPLIMFSLITFFGILSGIAGAIYQLVLYRKGG
jgi:cytochrome bd-type quinol oxidase subunit 2